MRPYWHPKHLSASIFSHQSKSKSGHVDLVTLDLALSNMPLPKVLRSPRLSDILVSALTGTWPPCGGLTQYRTEHPRWAGQVPALVPIPLFHTLGFSKAEVAWAMEVAKMDSFLEEGKSSLLLKSESRGLTHQLHESSQSKACTPSMPIHPGYPHYTQVYYPSCAWTLTFRKMTSYRANSSLSNSQVA